MSDEPKDPKHERPARSFETEVEIDAPPERVWEALTVAEDLVRWFPLSARVTPGVGGSYGISWGESWASEARIEIWEPRRRLRTVTPRSAGYDADGKEDTSRPPLEIAVEYVLEARDGRTVLRLVHSGFGRDASWDDEFDSISRGWKFELGSLRHYLERHPGTPRTVAWARKTVERPAREAWALLTGSGGLLSSGHLETAPPGADYSLSLTTGDAFDGTVVKLDPGFDFAGTARGWNDGYLRLGLEAFGTSASLNVWLATWGVDGARVTDFASRAQAALDRLA
jgi:uncharacterized protein YndB with AHSA1/START domain